MIKIRRNVFETNSSSTHSITIEDDYDNSERIFKYTKIPRHTNIDIEELEFNEDGNNVTEWQKLNCLIDFLMGYYGDDCNTNKPLYDIIKNVIKDKCDSNLDIDLFDEYHFAIYDDDCGNILEILDLNKNSTEDEIYNRFKEIIFNPKINFKHKDNEY